MLAIWDCLEGGVLHRRTPRTATDSPWPDEPPDDEGPPLISGVAVGQVSQWVCPTRHRHDLFKPNLSQQADVGQQSVYKAFEGAPHGLASGIEGRRPGEMKMGPEDRLSGCGWLCVLLFTGGGADAL